MPSSRARCLRNGRRYGLSRCDIRFFARKKMTRGLAVLVATVAMLAASGNAQAESFDLREIMGGGPDFRGYGGGGVSPIQRSTPNYSGNYAPGTIVINTGQRRPYPCVSNGPPASYGPSAWP